MCVCLQYIFYPKLLSGKYEAVQRWTRGDDVLYDRLLLFPIHLEMHWCLASVNSAKKEILYYNSLMDYNTICMRHLRQYMEQVSAGTEYSDSQWTCSRFTSTPKQLNSFYCGVYVLWLDTGSK